MRALIDCHIHTAACGHAEGSVQAMYDAARVAGLSAIVFTEHLPLPDALDTRRHLSPDRVAFSDYVGEVLRLRSDAPDDGPQVVLGAEVDWLPNDDDYVMEIMAWARDLGVAVFLGSVHFIGEWAFDDPHGLSEWDRRDVGAVWTQYFDLWCDAARSGRFDVMAHPDLVKKFGHFPDRDCGVDYRRAAQAASDSGVLIEVSTAGLRRPVGEMYPSLAMLEAFHAAGVSITLGSDAHSPGEVGWGLDLAREIALSAGYRQAYLPMNSGVRRSVEL